MMNNNGFTNPFRGYLESMRPHAYALGKVSAAFGSQVIDLLMEISRNTGSRTTTRRFVDAMNYRTGATARVVIDPAGANNAITYTAVTPGVAGNLIRVTYVVAGLNTALSVTVAGNDITVNVATDAAGAPTSTASQVIAAVVAAGPAAALVTPTLTPGNDGTGVVAATGFTTLGGGSDAETLKQREVQPGQQHTLKLLAVNTATLITIRSGGRLMYVKNFAGADTIGPDAQITAGPGASYDITSSAPAEVTAHVDIIQRDDARPGVSGERVPLGLHTNHMDLAIQQHFPGFFEDPDTRIHHPAGTLHGASD